MADFTWRRLAQAQPRGEPEFLCDQKPERSICRCRQLLVGQENNWVASKKEKKQRGTSGLVTAYLWPARPTLAVLFLMAILTQALFTLVRCDLVTFPFFSARHIS